MPRDPRYDVLFEPVQIGPVRAPNRFYQVPHCTGLGYAYPNAQAALRAMKAEGGWGVVSTQLCEIHFTSDLQYHPYDRLWDDEDIPVHARMVDEVHRHGALAAVELGHVGLGARNLYSRVPAIGPASLPSIFAGMPGQSRAMDKEDIRDFRRWHRAAALRAKAAGFDIVYVYAAHNMTLPFHFLSRRYNTRTDEYGGSLENRVRLLRELILDTHDAVGVTSAVAVRFAVDELLGGDGLSCEEEGRDVLEMLAELPDLWDVNISGWANDSMTSRFAEEGFQERYVAFVKQVTTKPVVGVGRFTSPDAMVSQIRRGILDFIGAARPSIADPFLPRKIAEGRPEDIRECIGCNVCVSTEMYGTPIRCTQNPTMGEEWRKGWHPEALPARTSHARILIIGAGPAGLECAMSLGRRGYEVALAEASRELGGRVIAESRIPGLRSWIRVRDYRAHILEGLANVTVYRESRLGPDDVLGLGFDEIVIATGASWRRDGIGASVQRAIAGPANARIFTPDDIHAGADIPGPVLIYDDDHYYLASALAEMFRRAGKDTSLVTPLAEISSWTTYTLEQRKIQAALLHLGVGLRTGKRLDAIAGDHASFACVYTGEIERVGFRSLVLVTARHPSDALYHALAARRAELASAGIRAVRRIGDCLAPSTIAAAVYSGHVFARGMDEDVGDEIPFRRERIALIDPN